jgi:adenylate/guanylate cyclase family protein
MSEAKTSPAKYVFLDVVSFTRNRSVEAQSDIVEALNGIVTRSISELEIPRESLILIPTGDGICIALVNVETPYDIHIRLALQILAYVNEFNKSSTEDTRRFQIRIGVNSNIDNVVTDVNGNRNVAGDGISMASRVMGLADGGQILVAAPVYDILKYREAYMSSFRPFNATVKHDVNLDIYQLIAPNQAGLNTAVPLAFIKPEARHLSLTEIMAHYFAEAIRNESTILKLGRGGIELAACVLILHSRAEDSVRKVQLQRADSLDEFSPNALLEVAKDFKEQVEQFNSWEQRYKRPVYALASVIISHLLSAYSEYFQNSKQISLKYSVINLTGREKLKTEWPDIWNNVACKPEQTEGAPEPEGSVQ